MKQGTSKDGPFKVFSNSNGFIKPETSSKTKKLTLKSKDWEFWSLCSPSWPPLSRRETHVPHLWLLYNDSQNCPISNVSQNTLSNNLGWKELLDVIHQLPTQSRLSCSMLHPAQPGLPFPNYKDSFFMPCAKYFQNHHCCPSDWTQKRIFILRTTDVHWNIHY